MDTSAIISKLNRVAQSAAPGAILEKGRLAGPDPLALVWLETKQLRPFFEGLCSDPGLAVTGVENITVAQVDDALMVTYFFRASSGCFALRATTVPASPDAWAALPTIRDLWMMAAPLENYVAELFGIRFSSGNGADNRDLALPSSLLSGWQRESMQSFPLRKNFVAPPAGDTLEEAAR